MRVTGNESAVEKQRKTIRSQLREEEVYCMWGGGGGVASGNCI